LPHARIIGGKKVFNVLPADAMDKGQALLRLMRAEKYRHALFIGDDETDEYAFRAAPRPSIITVRVGADRNSAADWYVRGQRDVDELLARIIRLKIEASRNPGLHRR
jgi:trehalose 6-phosphate phosphatase